MVETLEVNVGIGKNRGGKSAQMTDIIMENSIYCKIKKLADDRERCKPTM